MHLRTFSTLFLRTWMKKKKFFFQIFSKYFFILGELYKIHLGELYKIHSVPYIDLDLVFRCFFLFEHQKFLVFRHFFWKNFFCLHRDLWVLLSRLNYFSGPPDGSKEQKKPKPKKNVWTPKIFFSSDRNETYPIVFSGSHLPRITIFGPSGGYFRVREKWKIKNWPMEVSRHDS